MIETKKSEHLWFYGIESVDFLACEFKVLKEECPLTEVLTYD